MFIRIRIVDDNGSITIPKYCILDKCGNLVVKKAHIHNSSVEQKSNWKLL